MARQSYLDAINERIIVFDGAFGTFVQDLDLGPDDFGGPTLEGCNEMLCLTRPDVIQSMHSAFLDVGVDALETATFGSFSVVLNEYQIPEKAHELNVVAARLAREVADGYEADGRSALRRRLDRARHEAAEPRPHRLRRAARRLRGSRLARCSRAASTCS